jgi:hypothetical protein
MANEDRFSGWIGGLNRASNPSQDKETEQTKRPIKSKIKAKAEGKKSTVKSKDPGYTQIGVYLPNELHRKMKIGAAMTGLEMSEIAAQAVELWLAKNAPNI